MVRFSCFPTHIHHHRSKKLVESSRNNCGEMHKDLPGFFHLSPSSASSNLKDHNLSNSTPEQSASPSSFECYWKSEELNGTFRNEGDKDTPVIKRSQSLGDGIDTLSCVIEDESGQGLSFDNPMDENIGMAFDSFSDYIPKELHKNDDSQVKFLNQDQENTSLHSFETNTEAAGHDSIFSIGDLKQEDNFHEGIQQHSPTELVDLGHFMWNVAPLISKSHSLSRLELFETNTGNEVPAHQPIGRNRSFNNFCTNSMRTQDSKCREEFHCGISCQQSINSSFCQDMPMQRNLLENEVLYQADSVEEYVHSNGEKKNNEEIVHGFDDQLNDGCYSQNSEIIMNGCREPEIQGDPTGNNCHNESSFRQRWDDLPSNEFNRKRIEDWLSQIDIQDNFLILDNVECSNSDFKIKEPHVTSDITISKPEARGSPSMEGAYNYISTLTALSTSAQMAYLGLVVVPFLGTFSGLRLLNLAGNSIVRITSGALPRGLHMLNLSKNNISTIEGFRELTRLRILDLSYNRIMRIGHGLASCLSLKELYLAGNKISEVEGLHRLLKLHVLDLRFNKISTVKCLGQLAANYGSLQTINLEGNPAQRNVGDEQLKRYLLGILPHLVYYNRHIIRAGSSKEILDRSSRSFSPHQFDRGLRSEQKRSRRGHHNSALKSPTLSHRGKTSPASSSLLRHSRGRHAPLPPQHAPLPPLGSKPAHNLSNIGSKLMNFRPSNSIRRSRSEGNL